MIQNVFMYLDSIVCNLLLLGGKGNLSDAFTSEALSSLMSPLVLLLILNNAVLGIVTSLFLQVIQSFAQFHILFAETKLGCESLCVCLRAGHNSIGETDREKQGEYCMSAISSGELAGTGHPAHFTYSGCPECYMHCRCDLRAGLDNYIFYIHSSFTSFLPCRIQWSTQFVRRQQKQTGMRTLDDTFILGEI